MATKTTDSLAELHQRELELSKRLLAVMAELPAASAALHAALVSGTARSDAALETRSRLSLESNALSDAIDAVRSERRQLIAARIAERAAALRQQAATLRVDAGALQARIDALLAQLRDLAGTDYVPAAPPVSAIGNPLPESRWVGRSVKIVETQATALQRQAERLEHQAASLAAERPQDGGSIRARSRDDLIEKVQQWPVDKLGPRLDQVVRWLSQQTIPPDLDHIALEWLHGEIRERASQVVERQAVAVPSIRPQLRCLRGRAGTYEGTGFEHMPGQLVSGDAEYLEWLISSGEGAYERVGAPALAGAV